MISTFKKKPHTVTRYITNLDNLVDRDANKVKYNLYYNEKNKNDGEISVFDIDGELNKGDKGNPYIYGDKRLRKHPSARADLLVEKIENISDPVQLLVERSNPFSKHCNIKPLPNDRLKAMIIANKLVLISELHYREGFRFL